MDNMIKMWVMNIIKNMLIDNGSKICVIYVFL